MTEFALHDAIGVCGTLMVGLAYLATQMRWLNSDDLAFPLVNLGGSVLISYSLYHNFNLASALMEGFWIAISVLGIWQYMRTRR
ncbi:CBU_0592 family membrane protein [Halocynthiibacter namhaensis]|uniref:CBU_0592 family membrane protein n=1 Tax=Halocynthiibacter namhaensis TaxID=1290553 RepID=UPI0005792F4C|nr:hypothetical protein [Halocynthiibacter namhaensis]